MAPLLLTLLAFYLAGCNAQEGASTVFYPSGEIVLQASASCCPVDLGAPCNESDCPAVSDDQFMNIADGSALTEWIVSFVSDVSENGPSAEISFDLGEVRKYVPQSSY